MRKLIAGPGVYICDECIDLCLEIMAEEGVEPEPVGLDRVPPLLETIKRNQELLAAHQNELAALIETVRAEIEVERLKRDEPSA